MKYWFWPRSLATRTALVLLAGLALVQVAGLTIHAFDRIDLQRLAQARNLSVRLMSLYRSVVITPPGERDSALPEIAGPPSYTVMLSPSSPAADLPPTPAPLEHLLRIDMDLVRMPGRLRPHELVFLGGPRQGRMVIGMRLPDDAWLNVSAELPPIRIWHSRTFLAAFLLMTATAAVLIVWAVRRLTAPVRTLAAAAEALGRDVNAPPLPERGPEEIATAAAAFNTMAARIRRFVQDRTELFTAIGHDLRTPITRLKLRAEFMEDDEQRRKMLADLQELETMVSATLAFGRDSKSTEPVSALDLAELLRTVLDEAQDARPEVAALLAYEGPSHLTVRARPLALKRAFANLVGNAVNYGGGARVRLVPPQEGTVRVEIEDDGPGIPPSELERIFEPFHRVESSRNRETGGVGLGL
ncbi:MAG: HAMP domain-containing protein, partial [Acetobacteraceae bacterium]|nr:HAMP domain-containing protein [Acetobacteraceae bacterium]